MYEPTQDAIWMHGIDLAQEAEFDLGFLRVRPARCEVEWNGATQTLQRRVMQVLVALAQARGSVVSQDDLVMRCWRGLSVSDDAIFRCISKLRKLAAGYGDAPYAIETIPGVGYRLTSSGQNEDAPAAKSASPHDRRFRLGAMAAAAALAALLLLSAIIWIGPGSAPDGGRAIRVTVQPFDTLSNSDDARSLARRIPNEVVNELGDSQVETVLGEVEAGKKAPGTSSPAPGLIVTGLVRDDAPNVMVNVRVEDGATHSALWSMEFKRDRRESSDLPLEVAARVADIVNMAIFARTANPPLTDPSGLSALLQTTDMIRDAHGGRLGPNGRKRAGPCRAPPWNLPSVIRFWLLPTPRLPTASTVPAQAQADEGARPAGGKSDTQTRSRGCRRLCRPVGHRAALQLPGPGSDFAARHKTSRRHPKEPLGALYSYEGTLLSSVGRLREALSFQLVARAKDEWGPPKRPSLRSHMPAWGIWPQQEAGSDKRSSIGPIIRRSGPHGSASLVFYEQPAAALPIIDAMDAGASTGRKSNAVWRNYIEAKAARSGPTGAAIQKIRDGCRRRRQSPVKLK